MARIAIDLTPILPGGENGGAKLMTIELIRGLSRKVPDWEFFLLTSEINSKELSILDRPNVRRIVASGFKTKGFQISNILARLVSTFPSKLRSRLLFVPYWFVQKKRANHVLHNLNIDLLFCPFTAPFFHAPGIPTISIIYDLQFKYYPQFFSPEDRFQRERHFIEANRYARKLICISNYVKRTVIENYHQSPDRVKAIHIRLPFRLPKVSPQKQEEVLARNQLDFSRYLLYPANFWEHKNHQMLLTALGMFRAQHRETDLKLVCTGNSCARMQFLKEATKKMGLSEMVTFPGYLSDEDFSVLMQGCKAVIFPSLYEGFGMPVLEAMALGKPVLCSNVSSLPEIAGEAALFFDPRKPQTILNAIQQIENEPELEAKLRKLGEGRVREFGNIEEMIIDYLKTFQEVIGCHQYQDSLDGIFEDGWCGARVCITYSGGNGPRRLEMALSSPPWLPSKEIKVKATQNGSGRPEIFRIARGKTLTIQNNLSKEGGVLELFFENLFQPKALGLGEDSRFLGAKFESCRIVASDKMVDLFEERGGRV